jgi:hypothetical protein
MKPEDIKVNTTEPQILKNTLPSIFDRSLRADFKYDLGKPLNSNELKLILKMEYVISEGDPKNPLYSYLIEATYTIVSQHPPYNNCQVFHECIRRSVEDFNDKFKALNVVNYPPGKIVPLSFDETLPRLIELYYPHLNQGLQ